MSDLSRSGEGSLMAQSNPTRIDWEDPRGTVEVGVTALNMLYDCARSYDTRIPDGNGREWVTGIERILAQHGRADLAYLLTEGANPS